MKILIFLFYLTFSMNIHATPSVSGSLPVNRIIAIEKLATKAQTQLDDYRKGKLNGNVVDKKTELEKQFRYKIEVQIDDIVDPKSLYTMYIIITEGYNKISFETLYDRLMWQAEESIVMRLAQLGTEEAYNYFIRLKEFYGSDGGGSLIYRSLEFKYLKKYSRDPRVIQAKSANEFI